MSDATEQGRDLKDPKQRQTKTGQAPSENAPTRVLEQSKVGTGKGSQGNVDLKDPGAAQSWRLVRKHMLDNASLLPRSAFLSSPFPVLFLIQLKAFSCSLIKPPGGHHMDVLT